MTHKQKLQRKLKGTPIGFKHNWNYKRKLQEHKISPKLWIGKATGTKTKIKPTKYMGTAKIGDQFFWRWDMLQRTKELSKNKYKTDSIFKKRLLRKR